MPWRTFGAAGAVLLAGLVGRARRRRRVAARFSFCFAR